MMVGDNGEEGEERRRDERRGETRAEEGNLHRDPMLTETAVALLTVQVQTCRMG
jgi:hypothetical protein